MAHQYEDELRALQRRAYGRDGDIWGDPESLRRLRELEGKKVISCDVAFEGGIGVELATPGVPERSVEEVDRDGPVPDPPQRLWRTFLTHRWVIVALLVLLAVSAGAMGALIASSANAGSPFGSVRRIAVLERDTQYKLTGNQSVALLSGNPPQAFDAFHGLRFVIYPTVAAGSASDECLVAYDAHPAVVDPTNNNYSLFFDCGAGSFPATVQFRITKDLPEALRAAFPKGTVLQFAYNRSTKQISVFLFN